jgi:iron complex outermembrane recepter protein
VENRLLRNAIRLALLPAAIVGAIQVQPLRAQAADDEAATEMDTMVVTGSRIKRVDAESEQLIFTLDREDIQAEGLTSIGDVIQNLTANGSALNTTFNNGGNGQTQVSLRNLGANRTLVLVNGRRWIGGTGLGGAVDLNTIPTAAVDRIEVLKEGASAVYGSDAIGGVVNVILRTDYEGAEANAYYGEFSKGDGNKQSYDFTVGAKNDRFSSLFGASYVKEEPVFAGDRAISEEPQFGTGNAFGSSTTPEGRFGLCSGTINAVTGTCSVGETRPDGSAGQFTYNAGQSGLNWRNRTGNDLYNFAPDNYLATPQERVSLFGTGAVDLTDNLRFTATGNYNNRKSELLLAAMPIVLGSGPGAGTQSRTISISANSIYNPFGAPVSRIQRRAVETGGRSFVQNVDTFAFSGIFDGSFQIGEHYFSWDAGYMFGRNDENDTTTGLFSVPALRQALGPSMVSNGTPICVGTPGNAATIITGCVPLNLLGAPGTITREMLDFTSFVAHDELQYKTKSYTANLSGDMFKLPAGMLSFAAGLEHRTEFGFDQPDALINSGNTTGNARTATRGGYSLDEAYLELAVPVLTDMTFAKELSLSLASRYSDYSNFGTTTNSKVGLRWKPIDDLMIRGNWAEGFRAPDILALFQGVADSFPPLADPCSNAGSGGGNLYANLTPTQQANCHLSGVPVGGYDQGNTQIRIQVGGNVNLTPETSESKTLGAIWSPEFLEGFDVSLDWWNVRIENTITGFGGQFIVNQCINGGPTGTGVPAFCTLISRTATGSIESLLSAGLNAGGTKVEGYDLTMNYRLPDTRFGSFSFNWDSTYMDDYSVDNNGDGQFDVLDYDNDGVPNGTSQVGQYFNRFNDWRIRSNFLARWEKGDYAATWSARYYSAQSEFCGLTGTPFVALCNEANVNGGLNHIGATTYHDVAFYWNSPWNSKITLGVKNLFEKEPPISTTTFANSFDPAYEIPGRFFYLQFNQQF